MNRVTKLPKQLQPQTKVTKVTKLDIVTAGSLSLELSLSANLSGQSDDAKANSLHNTPLPSSFPVLEGSFTGNLLVAMPNMNDQRFRRSVIYLCAHSQEGAMGIIINRLAGGLSYGVLMSELGIDIQPQNNDRPVFFGGPIEPTRGFILHTTDHIEESSLLIDSIVDITKPRGQAQNIKAQNLKEGGKFSSKLALSTTTDMLRAIHQGKGPNKNILVLGYAGWGPGQLELELQTNSWLAVSADEDLIFGGDTSSKWKRALGKLGIDPAMLSSESGHA